MGKLLMVALWMCLPSYSQNKASVSLYGPGVTSPVYQWQTHTCRLDAQGLYLSAGHQPNWGGPRLYLTLKNSNTRHFRHWLFDQFRDHKAVGIKIDHADRGSLLWIDLQQKSWVMRHGQDLGTQSQAGCTVWMVPTAQNRVHVDFHCILFERLPDTHGVVRSTRISVHEDRPIVCP